VSSHFYLSLVAMNLSGAKCVSGNYHIKSWSI